MTDKTRTTLYLNRQLVTKAKQLGFNISKLTENCLKQAITTMEASNLQNNSEKGGTGTVGSVNVVGPERFERSTNRYLKYISLYELRQISSVALTKLSFPRNMSLTGPGPIFYFY